VELHSAPAALVRSSCAWHDAPLLSTMARYPIHSLFEGGNLSWAQSLLAPLMRTKERKRQFVPNPSYGTLRSFIAVTSDGTTTKFGRLFFARQVSAMDMSDDQQVRLLPRVVWIKRPSLLADAFLLCRLRCSLSASP
jgi:hypothetical protein